MYRNKVLVSILALGACSDAQPLVTPSAPSFAVVGAQVNGDEVTLDFEGLPDGTFTGSRFRDVGVGYADFYTSASHHSFFWYPPTSGSSQIIYAEGPFWEQIRNSGMWFTEPVKEVSMSVTAGYTFSLKCYNGGGELLGSDSTDGAWKVWADNGYLVPLVYPFPVVRQSVAARGIKHCSWRVVSGAGIDDIRFRRSTSELKVTCTGDLGENRVTRGKEIECRAHTDSETDQIEVETWTFTGTDSEGRPYTYPEDLDGPVTDNPWRGKMAVRGTVMVRARVNGGEPQVRPVQIEVVARSWDDQPIARDIRKVSYAEYPEGAGRPPAYPTRVGDLGKTWLGWRPLGVGQGVVHQITDHGPNHYLVYFEQIPAELVLKVLVHPEMESRGEFWRNQPSHQPAYSQQQPCVQGGFDRYVELILVHEGIPLTPRSHAGVYIGEVAKHAGPEVEALVYPVEGRQAMAVEAERRLKRVMIAAAASAGDPVDDAYPVPFGCLFNYDPR